VNVGLVINFELPETPPVAHPSGRPHSGATATRQGHHFLSEEDGEQWRKLRRLGAPALPEIDGTLLPDPPVSGSSALRRARLRQRPAPGRH